MNSEQFLRALKIKFFNEMSKDKKIVKYDEKDEILDTIFDFLEEAIVINQKKKYTTKIQDIRFAKGRICIYGKKGMRIQFDPSCYKLNYLTRKIESYNYNKLKETISENIDDFSKIGYRVIIGTLNIYIYL